MGLFDQVVDSFVKTSGNELGKSFAKQATSGKDRRDDKESRLGEVAKVALHVIMYGLYKNSKNQEDKQGPDKAAEDHRSDRDGLRELMSGNRPEESKKMVDHVFRGKGNNVSRELADQAGVSQAEVDAVPERLTPSVIAMLTEEKEKGRDVETSMEDAMKDPDSRRDMDTLVNSAKNFIESGAEDGSLLSGVGGILKNILS